ncbi:hypothetical protein LZ31DRAFT_559049 [Colletotrichum somersetense]|nr:hypothetical protein LZ31DRAFT_559049 [Colletotrichum somersetense]
MSFLVSLSNGTRHNIHPHSFPAFVCSGYQQACSLGLLLAASIALPPPEAHSYADLLYLISHPALGAAQSACFASHASHRIALEPSRC